MVKATRDWVIRSQALRMQRCITGAVHRLNVGGWLDLTTNVVQAA